MSNFGPTTEVELTTRSGDVLKAFVGGSPERIAQLIVFENDGDKSGFFEIRSYDDGSLTLVRKEAVDNIVLRVGDAGKRGPRTWDTLSFRAPT